MVYSLGKGPLLSLGSSGKESHSQQLGMFALVWPK